MRICSQIVIIRDDDDVTTTHTRKTERLPERRATTTSRMYVADLLENHLMTKTIQHIINERVTNDRRRL
jgi:hypothetical protein